MSTNDVTITETNLVVEPRGLDKLFSFRGRIEVPLDHVRGATFDPGMMNEPKGIRAPGLRVPGKLSGTFHADGERQFWNVSGADRTVVIELDPSEHFTRLIISVDDPRQVVDTVNQSVHH